MSTNGIYTALSGAMAQSQRLDTIANNISNVNTTAFKKDKQTFREYVVANEKAIDLVNVPRVPASIESFYDMQGGDRGYVDSAGTFTDFTQGQLKNTGNKFNFGLEGPGFFEVLTPQGVQFTRNGIFKLDAQNRLVTNQGYPVLAQGAGNPEGRIINLEGQNITVAFNGDVYEGAELRGRIGVVNVSDNSALKKVGAGNYTLKENLNAQIIPSDTHKVHQGSLEGSNVNIIKEMTDMITATRTFESTQKAIKAFDSMNQKLMNEVPRVGN